MGVWHILPIRRYCQIDFLSHRFAALPIRYPGSSLFGFSDGTAVRFSQIRKQGRAGATNCLSQHFAPAQHSAPGTPSTNHQTCSRHGHLQMVPLICGDLARVPHSAVTQYDCVGIFLQGRRGHRRDGEFSPASGLVQICDGGLAGLRGARALDYF